MARRVFGWTPDGDGEWKMRRFIEAQRRADPNGMAPSDYFIAGMLMKLEEDDYDSASLWS